MANDWQYPKGAYKAYVPKGRAWATMGQAIGGGLQNFASQWMAIKQYEAEKEEKRRQQMYERAQAQAEALAKEQEQQRQFMQQQILQDQRLQAEETLTRLRESFKEKEDKVENFTAEANNVLAMGMDVQTDLGDWFVTEYSKAWNNQDLGRIQQLMAAAPQYSDKLKFVTTKTTTKEGVPTETQQPTQDLGIIRNMGQQLLTIGGQMGWKPKGGYGYPAVSEEQKRRPVMVALQAPDETTYQEVKNRALRGGYPPEEWDRIEAEIIAEMERGGQ